MMEHDQEFKTFQEAFSKLCVDAKITGQERGPLNFPHVTNIGSPKEYFVGGRPTYTGNAGSVSLPNLVFRRDILSTRPLGRMFVDGQVCLYDPSMMDITEDDVKNLYCVVQVHQSRVNQAGTLHGRLFHFHVRECELVTNHDSLQNDDIIEIMDFGLNSRTISYGDIRSADKQVFRVKVNNRRTLTGCSKHYFVEMPETKEMAREWKMFPLQDILNASLIMPDSIRAYV